MSEYIRFAFYGLHWESRELEISFRQQEHKRQNCPAERKPHGISR